MKRWHFILAGIVLAALASPACAEDSLGTLTTNECDISSNCPTITSTNAYLGARTDAGQVAVNPIDISGYNLCRYVDNGSSHSLFVPFRSAGEWGNFVNHGPASNPGLSLVNCSKPQNGLQIAANKPGLNPSPASPQTVNEPNYYRCAASGANCVAPYKPTWTASVTYSYNPGGNSGPWTETAKAVFTGLNSDYGNSWGTPAITYTSSPASSCGSANGQYFSSAPTSNLCAAGVFSATSSFGSLGPWTWTCSTYDQPTPSVSCQAYQGGICGPANGSTLSSAPSYNLCSAGAASGVSGSGPWSWTCGTGGGTTSCSALATPTCSTTTANWSANGISCSGSLPGVTSGSSSTASSSNGNNGSATYSCSNGNWSGPSNPTCSAPSCSSGNVNWSGNGVGCSGYLSGVPVGQSSTASSSNGNNGSATYYCNNGGWSGPSSSSCSAPGCSSTTASWSANGVGCSGGLPSASSGSYSTASSSNGNNGSATYYCSNGSWSGPSSSSCSAPAPKACSGQSVGWSMGAGNCYGSIPTTSSGSSATASGYSGSLWGTATYSCSNGSWSGPSNVFCGCPQGNNYVYANSCEEPLPDGVAGVGPCPVPASSVGTNYNVYWFSSSLSGGSHSWNQSWTCTTGGWSIGPLVGG